MSNDTPVPPESTDELFFLKAPVLISTQEIALTLWKILFFAASTPVSSTVIKLLLYMGQSTALAALLTSVLVVRTQSLYVKLLDFG